MPTAPVTETERLAGAAIAALSSLVHADPSLAAALARAIGEIRAKYPSVSVDPGGPPPDPGVAPATPRT